MKIKKQIILQDYDDVHDILYFHWGEKGTDYSEELQSSEGQDIVRDYDKKGRIVGLEIFDWNAGRMKKKKTKIKSAKIKLLKEIKKNPYKEAELALRRLRDIF